MSFYNEIQEEKTLEEPISVISDGYLPSLNKTIDSLLKQTKKPDKIFINIPYAYKRFSEKIENEQLPKFNNKTIEITRCEDCGPGTKLLGSLNKLEKDSLLILVDDDNIYEDYMVEKFSYFSIHLFTI